MKISLKSVMIVLTILFSAQSFDRTAHAGAVMMDPGPAIVAGGTSANVGYYIVGGIIVSAASLITCAMITGLRFDREMTLEEAAMSGLIPLGCLIKNSGPTPDVE